jgi:hypothetical protein
MQGPPFQPLDDWREQEARNEAGATPPHFEQRMNQVCGTSASVVVDLTFASIIDCHALSTHAGEDA